MPENKLKDMQQLSEDEKEIMNILNYAQDKTGFIPRSLLIELAENFSIPESQLHSLISFFNNFHTRPAGKHRLSVCCGTACYARGASLIYDRLEETLELDEDGTSPDGFVTVDRVYCIGACSIAPAVIEDEEIKGKIKSHQVPLLIEELRKKG